MAGPISVKYVRNIVSGTLRAMIRSAMVDDIVTRDLKILCNPWWVEKQTGVSLATLKVHDAKWMPEDGPNCIVSPALIRACSETRLPRCVPLGPLICPARGSMHGATREKTKCEEGDLNPHGCYPTSPSN